MTTETLDLLIASHEYEQLDFERKKHAGQIPTWAEMIKVRMIFVTPEMATEMLKRNSDNYRNFDKNVLKKMCDDIRAGRFPFVGDTICFEETRTLEEILTDGQHRLKAIEITGIGQWSLVVMGLPEGTRHAAGKDGSRGNRLAKHLSKAESYVSPGTLIATARFLCRIRQDRSVACVTAASNRSDSNLLAIIEEFPSLATAVGASTKLKIRGVASAAVGAWYWLAMCDEQTELLNKCHDILRGSLESTTTHPFAKCRDLLLRRNERNCTAEQSYQFRLLCWCWHKAKAGESVKRIKVSDVAEISDESLEMVELLQGV